MTLMINNLVVKVRRIKIILLFSKMSINKMSINRSGENTVELATQS